MSLGVSRRVAASEPGVWRDSAARAPSIGELVDGELRFSDGAVYTGPLIDGAADSGASTNARHIGINDAEHARSRGQRGAPSAQRPGTLRHGSGDSVYEGGFARGFYDGLGTWRSACAIQSGQFAKGVLAGRATMARARLACGATLDELLTALPLNPADPEPHQHAHAHAHTGQALASLLGPFFETPRLVLVVEIVHGMFAGGVLSGAGARFVSVRIVQTRADLGTLGDGHTQRSGAWLGRATPGDAVAGASWPTYIDVDAGSAQRGTLPAARHTLATRLDEMCVACSDAAAPAGGSSSTSASASASTSAAQEVELAGRAVGVREWLAPFEGRGCEVLRLYERGTWALASGRRGAWSTAVMGKHGAAVLGQPSVAGGASATAPEAGPPPDLMTDAAERVTSRVVPVLDGARSATLLEWRVLDAAGAPLHCHCHAYAGATAAGLPHGRGTLTVRTDSYDAVGEPNSMPCTVAVHDVYRGRFVNGQPHGQGVLTTLAGCYEGAFAAGRRHGYGIATRASGLVVSGERDAEGRKHGAITYAWPNGDRVTYAYVHGRRQQWFGASADPGNTRLTLVYALPKRVSLLLARLLPGRAAGAGQATAVPATPPGSTLGDSSTAALGGPSTAPVPDAGSMPRRLAMSAARIASEIVAEAAACAPGLAARGGAGSTQRGGDEPGGAGDTQRGAVAVSLPRQLTPDAPGAAD